MTDEGSFWVAGLKLGGPGDDYIVTDFDAGSSDSRVQDVDYPSADRTRFGRDYVGAPTWSWTVLISPRDGDVLGAQQRLAAAWRNTSTRNTPGAVTQLVVQRNGVKYAVWGRCRRIVFDAGETDWLRQGAAFATLDFKLDAPVMALAGKNVESLGLLTPAGDGGLIIPVGVPAVLSAGSSFAQKREGTLVVGGRLPAPFTLEVSGPVTGALQEGVVSGNGWRVELARPVAWDETLVVDTRSGLVTVNGRSTPGAVTARTRLTSRLSPGAQTFSFTGIDATASSRVKLSWFDLQPL